MRYSGILVSTLVAVASAQSTASTTAAAGAAGANVAATPAAPADATSPSATAPAAAGGSSGSDKPNAIAITFTSAKAGGSQTITWSNASSGQCKINLKKGISTDLDTMDTLATTDCSKGSAQVSFPSTLTDGTDYAIEIASDAKGVDPNFTPQFPITGGTGTGESLSDSDSGSNSTDATLTSGGNSTDSSNSTLSSSDATITSESSSTYGTKATGTPRSSSSPKSTDSASKTESGAGIYKVSFAGLVGGLMVAMLTL
jgi:hypothetical protein